MKLYKDKDFKRKLKALFSFKDSSGIRSTGRTHLLARIFIELAIENPGEKIYVFDHYLGGNYRDVSMRFLRTIQAIFHQEYAKYSPYFRETIETDPRDMTICVKTSTMAGSSWYAKNRIYEWEGWYDARLEEPKEEPKDETEEHSIAGNNSTVARCLGNNGRKLFGQHEGQEAVGRFKGPTIGNIP